MSNSIDLDRERAKAHLQVWKHSCSSSFREVHRFPKVDFDGDLWSLRTDYKTKIQNISFSPWWEIRIDLDESYRTATRCDMAEFAIADTVKDVSRRGAAWKAIFRFGPSSVYDLDIFHFRAIETVFEKQVDDGRLSPSFAMGVLQEIAAICDRLSSKNVIRTLPYHITLATRRKLRKLQTTRNKDFRARKNNILDRQIEALSDATRCMFMRDSRLDSFDRASLAVMGLIMSAPSRVNEPLCMSINDVFTVNDYVPSSKGEQASNELERVHMLLLQKGSKGADWSPKPALTFMMRFIKACTEVLIEGSKRSRSLVCWYEKNPTKLYLPPALEHLRGQWIDRRRLWQIINLTADEPLTTGFLASKPTFSKFPDLVAGGKIHLLPITHFSDLRGYRPSVGTVQAVKWEDLEPVMLKRVHGAMEQARRVTPNNFYEGKLSNMLALSDFSGMPPYLPGSIKYMSMHRRFNRAEGFGETVFEKLNLRLVENGVERHAWIMSHDPRRWLTTQAMRAKERLSDVLLNKWANRLSIDQLKHYFYADDIEKADQAAMPLANELADISSALQKLEGLETQYGLETTFVTVTDAGISMTSMDALTSAMKSRPVARSTTDIIIVYASKYGACFHQHYGVECRSYADCGACNNNAAVKGHLPTNEKIRERDAALQNSLIRQLSNLVTAHNRGIADDSKQLENHILAIVTGGVDLRGMAADLTERFHEVKDQIKNAALKRKLEEAYVMRGFVKILDDPGVASGALIRYHNPSRHAAPKHELGLEALGGRDAIASNLENFYRRHPDFGPTSVGMKPTAIPTEDDDNGADD